MQIGADSIDAVMGFGIGCAGFGVRHRELTSIDNVDATVHQGMFTERMETQKSLLPGQD
jgi:hypothetical protein